jgi:tRNA A-37 threonylcarbamoyl transferase component Bud32
LVTPEPSTSVTYMGGRIGRRTILMSSLARKDEPRPQAVALPVVAADAVIAAALRTNADVAWIEPSPLDPESYVISMERAGHSLAQLTIDAQVATAVIARLAFIAKVDLSQPGPVTGMARLRDVEDRERDLVLTVRTGRDLRAEALFVSRTARPLLGVVTAELVPGDRVDHYRLLARLGVGAMGSVFAVEHVALERRYALKVLHRDTIGREKTTDRFLREARAAARLQHPHIVDVFDFGYLADGRPYFVMELLDGHSVAEIVGQGAMLAEQAVQIALQLGDALAAAHEGGVIHADVSANNVIVTGPDTDPRVKLVDFGLSELRDTREKFSNTEFVVGTPSYVAPEMLRGHSADELSDQYAFGVLLFEMLHGAPPFVGDSVARTCWMHLETPVPPVTSPLGELPIELVALVARCLQKTPAARYPDMRAVLADLASIARRFKQGGWRKWLP